MMNFLLAAPMMEQPSLWLALLALGAVAIALLGWSLLRRRRKSEIQGAPKAPQAAEPLPAPRAPVPAPPETPEGKRLLEEARKAEYRAKKAEELEEKERRQKAREEEAAKQALEAAEAAAAQERRVAAEAGRTLAEGLQKTRDTGFMARLNPFFKAESRPVDESVLAELEEILFTADIGVQTASRLVELARAKVQRHERTVALNLKSLLREEVARIVDLPLPQGPDGTPPHVIMVVGVNGAGKTTTIGKWAAQLTASGKKVVLAAGDTFRAAATEQLDVWAERAHASLVKGKENSDPSSVVFEGLKHARDTGADVVIADTAGRLHTRAPLMEELKKVKRVMDKVIPGAPHEVLLVLDATTGQNAIAQARQFHEAVGVNTLALTKLDGTAKGGVIIGICDELKLPVRWVGVGEKVSDLRAFSASEFVDALFS